MKKALVFALSISPLWGYVLAAEPVDYLREVKPLLAERCFACHGALRQRSGLRLDAVELILRGGDGGPAVLPGKSAESLLYRVLSGGEDESRRMPPEGEGAPLDAEQIRRIRNWIDQGAKAPPEEVPQDPRSHWAYRLPEPAEVPAVSREDGGGASHRHPIDAFLAAERERVGVKPAPSARRDALLRRVYIDLTGLPPTREELGAFVADRNPQAYERVVDRLLASPRYGERWGRHWMDVWRYTDWFGLPNKMRHSQKHIWHWRDWIIESLNEDKGYDRMVLEMLAGDEIAPDDPDVVRGTGFLARSWYLYNRNTWLDDVIEHTGKAFLGVTFNCVKCHEHKYDPISHEDYYRFRAFFEPHRVRLDPVGTEVDFEKDGLPRAYDADLETETFLFLRGEEERPDKERSFAPGVPEVLGSVEGMIHPRQLSVEAIYPLLRPGAREGLLVAASARVSDARETLSQKQEELTALRAEIDTLAAERSGGVPGDKAERKLLDGSFEEAQRAVALAERTLRVKEAEEVSLAARVSAEKARFYPEAHTEAERDRLARRANTAERRATVRAAELSLSAAVQALAKAREVEAESAEKTGERVSALEKSVREAREKLVDAEVALGEAAVPEYTPVGAVYPATTSGRRLALARWIASGKNPLTARVAVNQIWMRHFGAPLVESVFDFGLRAPAPVQQKLLDWLAVDFVASGWSMKKLHRAIVISSAYRMSSGAGRDENFALARDPDNNLLWRMNPRRMDAEFLRDSLLYLAGDLDGAFGGADQPVAAADDGRRRTIYYRYARDDQIKFLTLFDAPNVDDCYRRLESIVPQQALAMSNSKLVLTRGRQLAARVSAEVGESGSAAFVRAAFEWVLGRTPALAEEEECISGLEQFAATPEARSLSAAEAQRSARESLVHVLLNHNDFITIR